MTFYFHLVSNDRNSRLHAFHVHTPNTVERLRMHNTKILFSFSEAHVLPAFEAWNVERVGKWLNERAEMFEKRISCWQQIWMRNKKYFVPNTTGKEHKKFAVKFATCWKLDHNLLLILELINLLREKKYIHEEQKKILLIFGSSSSIRKQSNNLSLPLLQK